MPQEVKLILGTTATTNIATEVQEFNVPKHCFTGSITPSIMCRGLVTAETVTLVKGDGSGYQLVYDMNGTQAILDAASTLKAIGIASPGVYGVLHSTLAAERKLVLEY